ncbi:SDR family oxidoreductase [Serpentinimonas barnesii]|uniref:SDR family oxidoreductase n=1 Tax=Serpentinimonas barnesii TaxID=1458427 RepID=UPI000495DD3B|nr:SDR family oxidoreductase [Serpentinimonas barnesii]
MNTKDRIDNKLLVTGASGHLGRRVVQHLLHTLGIPTRRLIVTTRQPERLANLAALGVEVRAANFDDANTLVKAFQGADRLLLISTDALDVPGRRLMQHHNAIQAAEAAGVHHVAYTSMPLPHGSPLLIAPDHAGTEVALAASALPSWSVLRNHWYFENLFMTLPQVLQSGKWYSAAGEGRVAHIARDDLALAAATALAGSSSDKTTWTLSGSSAYSTAEMSALIAKAVGRPIEVVPMPLEGLVQGMVGAGLPEPLARVFASFDTNTAAGRVADVTGDFMRLTGRQPQAFEAWLEFAVPALKD